MENNFKLAGKVLLGLVVAFVAINNDKQERKNNDLHQTLDGNKLKKVINSKQPTKLNLHIGPAQIGVIRNIITIIIFNRLSIILSQLLLP